MPVRYYDESSGLATYNVTGIHQDAKGFLWIATGDGLSRFDGYGFTNYGEREGLGHRFVNAVVEDREGNLWIATNGAGVARLINNPPELFSVGSGAEKTPAPERKKFVNYPVSDHPQANAVNAMLFDDSNTLWCHTDGGVYHARSNPTGDRHFEPVIKEAVTSRAIFLDSKRRLWFGLHHELAHIVHGQIIKYALPNESGRKRIVSIAEDRKARLLISTETMLFEFAPEVKAADSAKWKRLPLALSPGQIVSATFVDSKDALWIATNKGLIKYIEGRQTVYTTANGLSDDAIWCINEDREGNLWLGTVSAGLCKLPGEAIESFTRAEGLLDEKLAKVIEDKAGRIYVTTRDTGIFEIAGARAVPVAGSQALPFKNVQSRIIQDSRGDWWIGTDEGLLCFYGPELQLERGKKFGPADGISKASVSNGPGIYEDPAGKIWVGSTDGYLYCYDRAQTVRPLFQRFAYRGSALDDARRIVADPSGGLWIAGYRGIARFIDGRIVKVEITDGLPDDQARSLFVDSRGRLWIGLRYRGVSMTMDPRSEQPRFVNYSMANGLANDSVWTIIEDDAGQIYFGTGLGLNQFDPDTGRIRHISKSDGLAGNNAGHSIKDRSGNIWVATWTGVSKINPRIEQAAGKAPSIYFSRIRVAGREVPLPETGAPEVPEMELPASRNSLLIEFTGLSFQGEKALRYQYKLEGADEDWSEPSENRSLYFTRLSPGAYRLMVRAINQEGVISPSPAVFHLRILPPVWQRWWFVSLAALALAALAYALYRYRVRRLVEVERVRTRIATDLHDDLGSSLTQIAMLSEVVRYHPRRDDRQVDEWLTLIANISRESVQAMSDIVWAINPRKDRLKHLTHRMRRLASDIFVARGTAFDFRAPAPDRDITLGANFRREVFLIFKEAVNNLARHSGCTKAEIEFRIERGRLLLMVSDNGKGFDLNSAVEGNGLESMRERAIKLGGVLDIKTQPGSGSVVTLKVPIRHRLRSGHYPARDGRRESRAAQRRKDAPEEVGIEAGSREKRDVTTNVDSD